MVKSMTGYGRAKKELGGRNILVEIKSVNNRYLDCSVKLPKLFGFLEEKIKSYISARGISRGKIEIFVSIDILEEIGISVELDTAYATSYIAALRRLSAEFGLPDDITTMAVAANRDIFSVKKADEDMEREWDNVRLVLEEAVDAFIAAREREGANMQADILAKKARVQELAAKIAPLSEADIKAQYAKIEARIKQLIGDVSVDEGRLITECALFADKVAIDEELVRLSSHFEAFDTILESGEPVGRKLDFLLQEINRETNTIGSKACDVAIAKIVVEIKSELEKIREQIQNIE
ncbi:MAG: YicC family protein [Clostridia bacterium]|nr:YicC family protein [Clostridia bacterium]